jgi:hypothetical protein
MNARSSAFGRPYTPPGPPAPFVPLMRLPPGGARPRDHVLHGEDHVVELSDDPGSRPSGTQLAALE